MATAAEIAPAIKELLRTTHKQEVISLAWSPDGKMLASGSNEGNLLMCDLRSGTMPLSIDGLKPITSMAYKDDGVVLVTASAGKTVQLWDVRTLKPLCEPIKKHTAEVNSIALAPDFSFAASGGGDNAVIFWQMQDGNASPTHVLEGHSNIVWGVAVSCNASTIASGSTDTTVRVWNRDGTSKGDPFKGHTGWVWAVAFSPTQKNLLVSCGDDNSVKLWDSDQPGTAPLFSLKGAHTDEVRAAAFSRSGDLLVTGSDDTTVLISKVHDNSLAPASVLKGHEDPVRCVSFSPDASTVASGADDFTIRLWDVEKGIEL